MTEDETVGWHHQLDGHESEQAPGDWPAVVYTVAKSRTHLSNRTELIFNGDETRSNYDCML